MLKKIILSSALIAPMFFSAPSNADVLSEFFSYTANRNYFGGPVYPVYEKVKYRDYIILDGRPVGIPESSELVYWR